MPITPLMPVYPRSPVLLGAGLLLAINVALGLLCYALIRSGWKLKN